MDGVQKTANQQYLKQNCSKSCKYKTAFNRQSPNYQDRNINANPWLESYFSRRWWSGGDRSEM